MWHRTPLTLRPRRQGFHLVTDEILEQLPVLADVRLGLIHLQLLHTSASLTLNENADPDVRHDMALYAARLAPQNIEGMQHTLEGPDDMPAHVLASLFGTQVTLAVESGRLATGTWQGIWLGEHRQHGGPRRILATLNGEDT
ncbi:secondary thiamine-phosphate synthase enzyme [Chromohalobacter marismortui]|uniref:Secondary thiamine-phosphate synthase enzyme n=1 Tax=Chromohalobacter marismortui TaxID=42055 RepID=A0A4V3F3V6_9GAMM|nr:MULTISPECIES: secondary thiamine-phosphate synthase enzyme YjbQ [Chromohalobacter]MCI0508447.1 secondary thiamine-phosphate synthase enzyme YjbQ [Chromohalobacter sp.]MCI0594646.1 secondary thiamine-phosphate synthase enzyme YjbQ [Chromohalobacter sp.]TDU22926.1 secondary thiamine-phosphate synthase enzyme [Chromohalobacter marismortui]